MQRLREILKSIDRRTALIFLVAATLAPTWHYYLKVPSFERWLGTETGHGVLRDLAPPIASFAAMLLVLGVVPVLLGRWLLGDRLRDYGVTLGDVRYGLLATLCTAPVFLLPNWFGGATTIPELADVYPLSRAALASPAHFVAYEGIYLLFYVAWEVHFRGFLLLGAEKALGAWGAIGLSLVTTALCHLANPAGEFYSSVFAGIVWGWIALRTRSIFWSLIMHWAVGVTNDISLSMHYHGFHF